MQHMLIATRKYQFMEANMQRRAAGLKDKMPDIQKTLETVQFLKTRKVYYAHTKVIFGLTSHCSRVQTQ
jgi:hypothetical protein